MSSTATSTSSEDGSADEDDQPQESNDDEASHSALGTHGITRDDNDDSSDEMDDETDESDSGVGKGIGSGRTVGRSVVLVAGKRPVGVSEGDDDDNDTGVRIRRKRTKVDIEDESGNEDMDVDEDEEVLDKSDSPGIGTETVATSGRSRRRFYFEDSSSSSDDDDDEEEGTEEPTALLTLLRQKEEANAARRMKRAAAKDSPQPSAPVKKTRGKAQPLINDPYRELLNDAINNARTRTVYPCVRFNSSEIDNILWTTSEKERFFRALPRLGRYNPVTLAEEVRTKSVIEVQGYLDALARELDRRLPLVGVSKHSLLLMEDIPAAVEVSEDCERALEAEADRVGAYIERMGEKERKQKWGDEGDSLDLETAKSAVESSASEEGVDDPLLEPTNWLRLSERIFMASKYDKTTGRPAIHKQTLKDLGTLVKSVTQRLVHICLYQTHSRIKAHQASRYNNAVLPEVTRRDVAAALNILGMPFTSEDYWRKLPRRFQLNVISEDSKAKRGQIPEFMNYNDVEEELKVFEPIKFHKDPKKVEVEDFQQEEEEDDGMFSWVDDEEDELYHRYESEEDDNEDENEEDETDESTSNSEQESDGKPRRGKSELAKYLDTQINLESFLPGRLIHPLTQRQKKQMLDELHFINDDEKYLNAVDKFHSALEEEKLWKLLGGGKDIIQNMEKVVEESEDKIPEEPKLRGFRRLEKWKRDGDWRAEAEQALPIWQQKYYRKLWEREKIVRIKKPYIRRRKGKAVNQSDAQGNDDEEEGHEEEEESEEDEIIIDSSDEDDLSGDQDSNDESASA
ncbi:hypothetical protein TWF694_011740 [Orbilia ellipsospora]|uniref:Uncharacterized protein n=1 Tax=Orbilia ellipsospora TaxID=2528407 RepID=A0AAV9XCB8_9PEZI